MMEWQENTGTLAFRAESGDRPAQYRLGVLFLLGQSVEQDLDAALRWLKLAGEYGGAHLLAEKLTRYEAATLPESNTIGTRAVSEVARSTMLRAVTLFKALCDLSTSSLRAFPSSRLWGRIMRIRLGAGMKAVVRDGNRGPDGLSETI